jgi:apolipoprotein N-acyltransferase
MRSRIRAFLLAALSGLLGALCFPRYALWPLAFVAFVPLLVAIAGSSRRRALLLGWLTGTVGFIGAFSWVLPTIARFEGISSLQALPFFALFVCYYALQLAMFAGGVARMQDGEAHPGLSTRLSGLMFPAAWWVFLEWGFPKVIPWSLGDTLAASAVLRQGADVAGVYGLSFLVILVNAALAVAIVTRHPRALLPGAALLLLAVTYGWLTLHRSAPAHQDSALSVTIATAVVRK